MKNMRGKLYSVGIGTGGPGIIDFKSSASAQRM